MIHDILTINTSKKYNVTIGNDILKDTGTTLSDISKTGKAIIVCDSSVTDLYAQKIKYSLENKGFAVFIYAIKAEEKSKNFYETERLIRFLLSIGTTREDIIIALGGGICSDLAGFAASIYMRGIDYAIVPTTTLSAVDACIGGKTAINFDNIKNAVGSFHQPVSVIIDCECFKSLSNKQFSQGIAEAVKCGIIANETIIEMLKQGINADNCAPLVKKCLEVKKYFIEKDEYDNGIRTKLNLGHTVAHALEKLSKGKIPHGDAVSIGLNMTINAALSAGLCNKNFAERIKKILLQYSLPVKTDYSSEQIINQVFYDKKRTDGGILITLPKGLANTQTVKMTKEELYKLLSSACRD